MKKVEVVDYDARWVERFEELRSHLLPTIQDLIISIEHVGSTSVAGLAAKPIVDIDIIVEADFVPTVIQRLALLGYQHRGDLGIEGREAFYAPKELPNHHLYVCVEGGLALANHLALRDYLREHLDAAQSYSELKKSLAEQFPYDIDAYIEGKTEFILSILEQSNFSVMKLQSIKAVNQSSND